MLEVEQEFDWRLRPTPVSDRHLPPRYEEHWYEPFLARIAPSLQEGVLVLDVGSGRNPALPQSLRPTSCHYVGLDLSAYELASAPPESYDETYVADVTRRLPKLEVRFDLIVSWQALEHVRSMADALDNLYAYTKPGGRLVVLVSGRFSAFAIINQFVPAKFGEAAMKRLLGREPDSVFSAHYDRCYYSALEPLLMRWSSWDLLPLYRGATYFRFAPALQRIYLKYEDWTCRAARRNLATHYLFTATR
jgi:SAM-dependent methyltransferase